MNEVDGYKALRSQILQRFGGTTDPRVAELMTKATLILPASDEEMKAITQMADVAAGGSTNDPDFGHNVFAKGFTEYRLGNYKSALKFLRQADAMDIGPFYRTEAYLLLAMVRSRLGRVEDSTGSCLKNAADELEKPAHSERRP